MKMLSIIVPVYNVISYLSECINSLIVQSYKNCEIIIVDDGSTDGSSILCDDLGLKDKRIRVIHQQNKGLSAARNTGLNIATGDYIGFVDSDDIVSPDMFTRLIIALESHHAAVAICNLEVFNRKKRYKGARYGDTVIDYSSETNVDFYGAALDSSCNRVFRADVIRNNQLLFIDKNIVAQEDYWFQVRLFSHIKRIVTISESLYYYRERGSSITKSHSDGDITVRNINFYVLTQQYIRSMAQRNIEDFLQHLLMNLFISSINNAKASSKSIKMIVRQYTQVKEFSSAVAHEQTINGTKKGFRARYIAFTTWLLYHHYENIYSCFEALRLRCLRSNNRRDLYYK